MVLLRVRGLVESAPQDMEHGIRVKALILLVRIDDLRSPPVATTTLAAAGLMAGSRADEGLWAFDNPPTALVQQRYGFEQPTEPAGRAEETRRRNLAAVAELAASFLVAATARPSP
jgi:hypothetical protein